MTSLSRPPHQSRALQSRDNPPDRKRYRKGFSRALDFQSAVWLSTDCALFRPLAKQADYPVAKKRYPDDYCVTDIGACNYMSGDNLWVSIRGSFQPPSRLLLVALIKGTGRYCEFGCAVNEPLTLNLILEHRRESGGRFNSCSCG